MQGLTTTVNGTEQISATTTLQGPSNEWTCERWFNNIATNVSAKTHRYVGWLVAAFTAPVTFIPSLACDFYYGAKSLYERNVSKTESPIELQVSPIGREQPVTSEEPTISRSNSSEPTTRSELSEVRPEQPPTISYIRDAFPNMNMHLAELEAALNNAEQNLTNAEIRNAQIEAEAKRLEDQLRAKTDQFNAIKQEYSAKIHGLKLDIVKAETDAATLHMKLAEESKKTAKQADEIQMLRSLIKEQNANTNLVSSEDPDTTTRKLLSAAFDTIYKENDPDDIDTSSKDDDELSVEIIDHDDISSSPPLEFSNTSGVTVADTMSLQATVDADFEVISQ